jgi:hypothetical protein
VRSQVKIQAAIDGRPVVLTNWQCDSAVDWGYRTLTGDIPESVTWAEQESPVALWLPDGTELWAGKLSLDPQTDRGKRSIRAEGYASDLGAASTRMFYRIDSTESYVDADGDPHNYSGDEKIDQDVARNRIRWLWGNNADVFASGDHTKAIIWVEGAEITRYEFLAMATPRPTTNDIRVWSATGPSGTLTTVGTHTLDIGAPTTYAANIATPEDALLVGMRFNAASTPSGRRRATVRQMKIYGRTTDDSFSAGDVVADVGANAGFDTSDVQSNALGILPLDWTDSHPDLLSYMAELCDWQWQALGTVDGVPKLAFGPYETTWTAYQSHGVRPTWESQKRYNRVKVPFTYISGREGSRTAEPANDPFAGREVIYTTEPLEDPQQDGTLAATAAAAQAPYWASKRVAGRVELGQAFSEIGEPSDGSQVKPGQRLNVADRPDLGPQRIVAMSYRETGPPVAEINDDFNAIRLLAAVQQEKKRRRRHRRGK